MCVVSYSAKDGPSFVCAHLCLADGLEESTSCPFGATGDGGPLKGLRGPLKGPRGPIKGPRGPFKGSGVL